MILIKSSRPTSGFALLITIVIISVVLAVGISLLEITVKQISLSTTGRDSEVAFSGAQAAVECAQATLKPLDIVTTGPRDLLADCFDSSMSVPEDTTGIVTTYTFQFDWTNQESKELCSEADMYVIDASAEATPYVYSFSGQGLANITCGAGDVCTVVFARGFNRGCSELSSLRTVQRELTISF